MVDIDKDYLRKRVIEEACKLFGVTREELLGRNGLRKVNDARKAIVHICRTRLRDTCYRLGLELNRPPNSISVIGGCADALLQLRKDPLHFKEHVQWIESRIFYSNLINNHGQEDQKKGDRADAHVRAGG